MCSVCVVASAHQQSVPCGVAQEVPAHQHEGMLLLLVTTDEGLLLLAHDACQCCPELLSTMQSQYLLLQSLPGWNSRSMKMSLAQLRDYVKAAGPQTNCFTTTPIYTNASPVCAGASVPAVPATDLSDHCLPQLHRRCLYIRAQHHLDA